MTIDNIDIFDSCTAAIFAKLYKSFPVTISFDLVPISDFDEEPYKTLFLAEEDDEETISYKLEIYEYTIYWLKDAGYITYQCETNTSIENVVLTAKGLELLKMPSSICNSKSVGDQLVEYTKDGTKEVAKSVVKVATTEFFKFLL